MSIFRAILVDSPLVSESLRTAIAPEQTFLRDLTRLLDLAAKTFSSTEMLKKDYCQRYTELRFHLMSVRRLRVAQQKTVNSDNEDLIRRLKLFDELLFNL